MSDSPTPSESVSCYSSLNTKKLKSNVWEHFEVSESNPKKAICKYCPKFKNEYAYSNGGTKNLWNHLNSLHAAHLSKCESNQPSIIKLLESNNHNLFSQQLLENAVLKWIVKRNHSFLEIELIHHLNHFLFYISLHYCIF